MSNIDNQIIEILEEKDSPIFELSERTGEVEARIRTYIHRLMQKGYLEPTEELIKKSGGLRKYKLYTLVKYPDWFLAKRLSEDLEFLMLFFQENRNVLLQNMANKELKMTDKELEMKEQLDKQVEKQVKANKEFFSKNIARFRKIAQRIEANGGNSDE